MPDDDTVLDHYSDECPICKGVLLPERVEFLERENMALRETIQDDAKETRRLVKERDRMESQLTLEKAAADQWRDLYQAK